MALALPTAPNLLGQTAPQAGLGLPAGAPGATPPGAGAGGAVPPELQALASQLGVDPSIFAGANTQEEIARILEMLMAMLSSNQQMFQGMGDFAGGGAGAAAAGGAGGGGRVSPAAQQLMGNLRSSSDAVFQGFSAFGGGPTVAVVDDFNSSHGGEIAGIIQQGGANTLGFDVNGRGGLSGALNGVIGRLASGESIDAVNLSQQAFGNALSEQEYKNIGRQIDTIQNQFGVPVVVAAGNGGAGQQNRLADRASLVVENSNFGSEGRAGSSGRGNIRSEGQFTSQATANVSAQAAQLHRQGNSIAGVTGALQNKARSEGGSLDR